MKDCSKQEIGFRVKLLREEKGLTQVAFAEKIHCDRRTIVNIEMGNVALSPMVRLAICNIFAVKKEWLLEGEGEMYDDRWELLEQRAKELGEDVYHKLALLKATKKTYPELIEKLLPKHGGSSPREREYMDKLSEIFHTKEDDTISAITQNIDTFLKVPGKVQKKRKAGNDGA